MEGKFTKISCISGIIMLILVTMYYIFPDSFNIFKPKIDGEWKMITIIDYADMKDFIGMKIEWKMFISEQHNIIKGRAEKIKVNDNILDYRQRIKMVFDGSLKGSKILITYEENGNKRMTSGIIEGEVNDDVFTGNFTSTASNSKGKVSACKVK